MISTHLRMSSPARGVSFFRKETLPRPASKLFTDLRREDQSFLKDAMAGSIERSTQIPEYGQGPLAAGSMLGQGSRGVDRS